MRLDVMKRGWLRLARPLALAATAVLAACGGGSSAVEDFRPTKILSFGDEYSVLLPDGRKYSINAEDDTGSRDCTESPLWIQVLADRYGMVYPECNADGLAETKATSFAAVGAKADDVAAQVESYTAAGGTFDGALVTVLVGTHDVLEQYVLYETQGEAALETELKARGERLAATINGIVAAGAKVIVATAPDVGLTPYAIAERTTHTDTDRSALMSRMVNSLNFAMNVNLVNDGRFIGLVLVDDFFRAASRFPGSYGLADVVTPACSATLPDCTPDTLVLNATETNYLWADETRPGPTAHQRIGLQAVSRAVNNPF